MQLYCIHELGDGDTRHIGFKVQMPDAVEIASVSKNSIAISMFYLIDLQDMY